MKKVLGLIILALLLIFGPKSLWGAGFIAVAAFVVAFYLIGR